MRKILGDRKKVRYDEGLVDKVNAKYAKEPEVSEQEKEEENKEEIFVGKGLESAFGHLAKYVTKKVNEEKISFDNLGSEVCKPEEFCVKYSRSEDGYFHMAIDEIHIYLLLSNDLSKGNITQDGKHSCAAQIDVGPYIVDREKGDTENVHIYPKREDVRKLCKEYVEKYAAEWLKEKVKLSVSQN